MGLTRTTRREPDGFLRPYRIGAVVLIAFGVLCCLVVLQSPSLIFWTGERVQGTDDGGIVYYTVDGQERNLDSGREPPPSPVPVTVYADPDDASHDQVLKPAKWLDAGFVLLPFAAAGTVLAVGVARRRRFRRRLAADEEARREQATAAWLAGRSGGIIPADGPPPSRSSRWRRSSR